ncbi:MAG: hypothetical protein WCE75_00605 [Terracidiphilus sp.]
MAWYWWVAIGLIVLWLMARKGNKSRAEEQAKNNELEAMMAEARRQAAAARLARPPLGPELKPYLTRLCRVHATGKSFASPETRAIGQEIFDKHGHEGMVRVCDAVRDALGGGPARDLEYKWSGIGEWMG